MLLKRLINGFAAVSLMTAGVLGASAPAAAKDWGRGDHERQFNQHALQGHDGGRGSRWGDQRGGTWAGGRGAFAHHRDRDYLARNVAIGAFAAVLGLALAAQSQRVGHDYYDDRD